MIKESIEMRRETLIRRVSTLTLMVAFLYSFE